MFFFFTKVIMNTDMISSLSTAFNQSAPANGTSIVPLNFAGGSYLGQFNIFYTDSNGGREKFVSAIFNVGNSPQSKAVTWSEAVHAHSTSSASASLQTSISESLITSSVSPATASASLQTTISVFLNPSSASPATVAASSKSPSVSQSPSTNGSALGTGSIAAIVMGVVLCAGLAAVLVIYRLRKPIRALPLPANFVAEKDGSPSGRNEFSGVGQLFEMAGSDRVGTNHNELAGREII